MGYNARNDEIRDNVTRMRRALAFDLLALDGDDLRKNHFSERKVALRKVLKRTKRGIQYVEHTEGDGVENV